MKLNIFLILISLIFCTCAEKPRDNYEEFYDVIDEFLRFQYYDSDVAVIDELIKVSGNSIVTINSEGDTIDDKSSPPPPPGTVIYDINLLNSLMDLKLIDSLDLDFMYNQIKLTKDISLVSSKIDKQILRFKDIKPMFKTYGIDSAFQILNQKYKIVSFLQFSTPIFSKDGNKMLFDIEYHCGGLCGYGSTYLLEKRNNKWRIIYSTRNWVS